MEFGIFLQGYVPGPGAHDSEREHVQFEREMGYAIAADKHNWKYAWFGEHHALTEYSHISAPEVLMGLVAGQTDYIHLGTGINSLSPRKEHPVRFAERAATLDHVTNRRFEWGTGRGAGTHEMASFNILDKDSTKPEWEEVVREVPRMWEQYDYVHHGEHFTVPTPHNVLPKPYGAGHPPIWVACGNPGTFSRAGELGIGAIAFSFDPVPSLRGKIEIYKEAVANCTEPLGQFLNDNVMITSAVVCLEDRDRARQIVKERLPGYAVSMVHLYHDTMPKPATAITWPEPVDSLAGMMGDKDLDAVIDQMIAAGYILVGNPEEVAEQLEAYTAVGFDQLVFGLPQDLHHDEVHEVIEVFGDRVIPEHDLDRVHSTDRYRATAQPKYPPFSQPLPDVAWPTRLPETAG